MKASNISGSYYYEKRQMSIGGFENPQGIYTITINNARYQKGFSNHIKEVLEEFLDNRELFFGFYIYRRRYHVRCELQ